MWIDSIKLLSNLYWLSFNSHAFLVPFFTWYSIIFCFFWNSLQTPLTLDLWKASKKTGTFYQNSCNVLESTKHLCKCVSNTFDKVSLRLRLDIVLGRFCLVFSSTYSTKSSIIAPGKALHAWINILFSASVSKTFVANPEEASNNGWHSNFTAC